MQNMIEAEMIGIYFDFRYKVHIQSEFESFWQKVNPVYPNEGKASSRTRMWYIYDTWNIENQV